MKNDEIHAKVSMIAASIVDRLYPEIIKIIAESILEEIDFSDFQTKNIVFSKNNKVKLLQILKTLGWPTVDAVLIKDQARAMFYNSLEKSTKPDAKQKAFIRSWNDLVAGEKNAA